MPNKRSVHALPQSRSRQCSIYRASNVRPRDAIEALSRAMIPNKRHRGITGGEKKLPSLYQWRPPIRSSVWSGGCLASFLRSRPDQSSLGPIFSALRNGPLIWHGRLLSRLSVPGLNDAWPANTRWHLSHLPPMQDKRTQGSVSRTAPEEPAQPSPSREARPVSFDPLRSVAS